LSAAIEPALQQRRSPGRPPHRHLLCDHGHASGEVLPHLAYITPRGRMFHGKAEGALVSALLSKYVGKVQLVFTSPPFPLNRKKKYGNEQGEQYLKWIEGFAASLKPLLTPDGSVVIEMGNAWEPGEPVMSTLALQALLRFLEKGGFKLCQQFVCHNPARLPAPAEWVTIQRIRVKDAYTHVWWMGTTSKPKASNRRVLTEYSPAMRTLLKTKKYNAGRRPSEYEINETSFLKDNGGAIPSNVLTFSNTGAADAYQTYCRARGLDPHPARMPKALAEFFINFLTTPGDLVLDPFSGSNTTGYVAESLGRRWLAIEPQGAYVAGSLGRFLSPKGHSGDKRNGMERS
jgi:DNA modification methylase